MTDMHLQCAACGKKFTVNDEAENFAFWCPDCCSGHWALWVIA